MGLKPIFLLVQVICGATISRLDISIYRVNIYISQISSHWLVCKLIAKTDGREKNKLITGL